MIREYKDVLVVDDDEAIRLLLFRGLSRMGLTCDTAVDGQDALEKIASRRYSVVLSDLLMPRVNGTDFVPKLADVERASGERPVVVIMTAHPDSEKLVPLGTTVQAVVRKPIDVTELTEIVRSCVNARRVHDTPLPPLGVTGARKSPRTKSTS